MFYIKTVPINGMHGDSTDADSGISITDDSINLENSVSITLHAQLQLASSNKDNWFIASLHGCMAIRYFSLLPICSSMPIEKRSGHVKIAIP